MKPQIRITKKPAPALQAQAPKPTAAPPRSNLTVGKPRVAVPAPAPPTPATQDDFEDLFGSPATSQAQTENSLDSLFGAEGQEEAGSTDMFEEGVPTSGIPLDVSMGMGLKGSQMFGANPINSSPSSPTEATPQSTAQVGQDDETDEDWGDDAPVGQEEEAPVAAQAEDNEPANFASVEDAEEYLEDTVCPYEGLTEGQKRARLMAFEIVMEDRETRLMTIKSIASKAELPDGAEMHVTIATNGAPKTQGAPASSDTVTPSGKSKGPLKAPSLGTSLQSPSKAEAQSSSTSTTPKAPTLKGPAVPKLQAPKAAGKTSGPVAPANQINGPASDNPMLDKCKNVAQKCNAPRHQHTSGTGACFKPDCQCQGRCHKFLGPDLPVEDPIKAQNKPVGGPVASLEPPDEPEMDLNEPVIVYEDEGGGEVAQVASTKSTGPGQLARVDENSQAPAKRVGGGTQGQPASGNGPGKPQAGPTETDEGEGGGEQGEKEQIPVTADILKRMMHHNVGGQPMHSTYWPAKNLQVIHGGAESRRERMIGRVVDYWERAIHDKDEKGNKALRSDLDLTSNSYRVKLAADTLFQAIEEYAGPGNGVSEQDREKAVGLAAKQYLNAHMDPPEGQIDCDWQDYLEYCETFGLEVGKPLTESQDEGAKG